MSSDYVLAQGEEAARRLAVVNAVHGPDTERFLARAGLRPGMTVADIGCGVGTISTWLACQVGERGRVVGVDVSADQVATARAAALGARLGNVEFAAASAYDTGLPAGPFDLVFSRLMLMHLESPAEAIVEMRRILKPGGTLAVEDGDFTSPFSDPPCPAYDRCFELYRAIGARRGQHFQVGRYLYRLVREAGFTDLEAALVQPAFVRGDPKRLPEWTLEECASPLIEAGLTDREEVDRLVRTLSQLAADDLSLFGMARMTQVWARKPEAQSA